MKKIASVLLFLKLGFASLLCAKVCTWKLSEIITDDPIHYYASNVKYDAVSEGNDLAVVVMDLDGDGNNELFVTSPSVSDENNGNNADWFWYAFKNIGDGKWALFERDLEMFGKDVSFSYKHASIVTIFGNPCIVDIGHAGGGMVSVTFTFMREGMIKSIHINDISIDADYLDLEDEDSMFIKCISNDKLGKPEFKLYEFDRRSILNGTQKAPYDEIISSKLGVAPRLVVPSNNKYWNNFRELAKASGISVEKTVSAAQAPIVPYSTDLIAELNIWGWHR